MNKKRIGLVIPVFTTLFVKSTIDLILSTCDNLEPIICIVNDGQPDVKDYLNKLSLPKNVITIDLPKHLCFAVANNSGWRYMIDKFSDIELLGTINDDTKPYNDWLKHLSEAFDKYPKLGIAAPVMESIENGSIIIFLILCSSTTL